MKIINLRIQSGLHCEIRTQGGIREAEVSSARAKGREVHIIGP